MLQVPTTAPTSVPQHLAVIMNGNHRWARRRGLPKAVGHANGAKCVRSLVEACTQRGVKWLILFAFGTENWRRPEEEVTGLMGLFLPYLQKEASDMHKAGVRLKVIGDLTAFDARLNALIQNVEALTAHNIKITLTIAANYGGRWDMLRAVRAWHVANPNQPGGPQKEFDLSAHLRLADAPEPDVLVRTRGESRTSNFMLWQTAYTELYLTPTLWPDFNTESLAHALAWYAQRDRRFGGADAIDVAIAAGSAGTGGQLAASLTSCHVGDPFQHPLAFLANAPMSAVWSHLIFTGAELNRKENYSMQTAPCDHEMHLVKKGNQWHFGMKAHIGVDAQSYLAHTVIGTSANVNDVNQGHGLLHGEEKVVFADAGYQGASKRAEATGVQWHDAMRPGKRKQQKHTPWGAVMEQVKKLKASVRAKMEHPFQVINRQFGYTNVRNRGLKKNTALLITLFALSNIWMVRRTLFQRAQS